MSPVWFVFLCIAVIGIVGLVVILLVAAGEADRRAAEEIRGRKAVVEARETSRKSIAEFNRNLDEFDSTLGARARIMRGSGGRPHHA